MKKKTRVLALVLMVLMLVGMLPISIFALDPIAEIEQAKAEDLTISEIKEAFAEQKLTLGAYYTFDDMTDLGTPTESWEYSYNEKADTEYRYNDGISSLNLADHKKAFSIVTEENGNKALYLGNAVFADPDNPQNGVDYIANLENFVAMSGFDQSGDMSQDIFLSVDLKMGGEKISGPISLFNIIYRYNLKETGAGSGPKSIPLVSVDTDGTLYIGGSECKGDSIGKLSSEEYTRIAFSTDRATNKYYVFINGLIINEL